MRVFIDNIKFLDTEEIAYKQGNLSIEGDILCFVTENGEKFTFEFVPNGHYSVHIVDNLPADPSLRRVDISIREAKWGDTWKDGKLIFLGNEDQAKKISSSVHAILARLHEIEIKAQQEKEFRIRQAVEKLANDPECRELTFQFLSLYGDELFLTENALRNWDSADVPISEEVRKLSKLFSNTCQFNNNEEQIQATIRLLKDNVPKYYHHTFFEDHKEEFRDLHRLSPDECMQIFSELEDIDTRNTKNKIQFLFFLINQYNIALQPLTYYYKVQEKLQTIQEQKDLIRFKHTLQSYRSKSSINIFDIDLMTGIEFEKFISELFLKMGYTCKFTKTSRDQGIDLIVEKNGNSIGIQTKCYASTVSNSAIQEVVAGLALYHLKKGMVITNNFFTKAAHELAKANNIILWDRNILKEKIAEYYVNKP